MKKVKLLIAIIITIIIISAFSLGILIPKLKKQIQEKENLNYNDMLNIQKEDTDVAYMILERCIKNYIQYNIQEDERIKEILEEDTNFEKFDTPYYLKINSVYKVERMDDITYFIEALINETKTYFLINVDYISDTFNIRKINEQEFKDAKNDKVNNKYRKSIRIIKTDRNTIKTEPFPTEIIMNNYYTTYINMAINKPEIAFNMLDEEYKLKKFNNDISKYMEYIKSNQTEIENYTITNVEGSKKENYTEYKVKDAYNTSYIIKEYYYTNFKISLNDNSIESTEQIDQYNKLSNKEKATYNIEKVFSKINEKEYKQIYNFLDETFKNNNFKELQQFETYINQNFFENNVLGKISIQEQGKNYIVTVPYKESNSTAAEKRKKTFIIRLLEGTDFTMSFEI